MASFWRNDDVILRHVSVAEVSNAEKYGFKERKHAQLYSYKHGQTKA